MKKRSEVRGQRSEVRGQRSEVRGQRSEVREGSANSLLLHKPLRKSGFPAEESGGLFRAPPLFY
jgi:hypothetical protein